MRVQEWIIPMQHNFAEATVALGSRNLSSLVSAQDVPVGSLWNSMWGNRPYGGFEDVIVAEFETDIGITEVLEAFSMQKLQPGTVRHAINLAIHRPEVMRETRHRRPLIVPCHYGSSLSLLPVIVETDRGPKISEGSTAGVGWAPGARFLAFR